MAFKEKTCKIGRGKYFADALAIGLVFNRVVPCVK
jgi:hypothetical protein